MSLSIYVSIYLSIYPSTNLRGAVEGVWALLVLEHVLAAPHLPLQGVLLVKVGLLVRLFKA